MAPEVIAVVASPSTTTGLLPTPPPRSLSNLPKLLLKNPLLVTTQAVLEQPRNNLRNPDTNTARQHQQFPIFLNHDSTTHTRVSACYR